MHEQQQCAASKWELQMRAEYKANGPVADPRNDACLWHGCGPWQLLPRRLSLGDQAVLRLGRNEAQNGFENVGPSLCVGWPRSSAPTPEPTQAWLRYSRRVQ